MAGAGAGVHVGRLGLALPGMMPPLFSQPPAASDTMHAKAPMQHARRFGLRTSLMASPFHRRAISPFRSYLTLLGYARRGRESWVP